ncbi:ATP-binding protein [Cryptosporangium sp. NPDC048952]|uniref:ATP-binding protein n=1 Tax=Cryptosporangium sp. NPDC048952 TaxID=3363961 RepID=UPI00371AFC9C
MREHLRAGGATVDVPAALPTAAGEAMLIRQLLQNLLCNSIKYQHPDRPCTITLTADQEDGVWTGSVTDNGIGVPVEH